MRSYCQKVLPIAENIKVGLLKKFAEEYKNYVEVAERYKVQYDEDKRRAEERKKEIPAPSSGIPFNKDFTPTAPPAPTGIYQPSQSFERDYNKPLPSYNIPGVFDSSGIPVRKILIDSFSFDLFY